MIILREIQGNLQPENRSSIERKSKYTEVETRIVTDMIVSNVKEKIIEFCIRKSRSQSNMATFGA